MFGFMRKKKEDNPPRASGSGDIVNEFFPRGKEMPQLSAVRWFAERGFRPGNMGLLAGNMYGSLIVLGKDIPVCVGWQEGSNGNGTDWYVGSRTSFTSRLLSELNGRRWWNKENETPMELAVRVARTFKAFLENEQRIEGMVDEMDRQIEGIIMASRDDAEGEKDE